MNQNYPMTQKNIYSVPFLTYEHREFVLWFFTGSRCNLECTHCYVESSPKANKHRYLRFETFKKHLDDVLKSNFNRIDIYFTGGEPFLNPDIINMIRESLKYGETTILTNGTRITDKMAEQLSTIQMSSSNKLIFRLSLDGPTSKRNDIIRGSNAFNRAHKGLENLIKYNLSFIITAMRSWTKNDDEKITKAFQELMVKNNIPPEKRKLKILPQLRFGREANRERSYNENELFTEQCFIDYNYTNLQCSKCRLVTENGVWVCPILVNEDKARMGDILDEKAFRPFEMRFMACWTCRMEDMNCTND
ncbi:MAG: radical SAM protein [Candidatus Hodarchaeales archaeon]|jgi:MoaA/NifB/PqqE/SkfB family radical SAM enzyme